MKGARLSTSQGLTGETWNFQLWYRDTLFGGVDYNFSGGLTVTFCDYSELTERVGAALNGAGAQTPAACSPYSQHSR